MTDDELLAAVHLLMARLLAPWCFGLTRAEHEADIALATGIRRWMESRGLLAS